MFQLTKDEFKNLIIQSGISSSAGKKNNWGGTRKLPYAFTEQGVSMLSSVLRSKRAVQVNIAIMRVFVKIRELITTHKELAQKLKELELKIDSNDKKIKTIFEVINRLLIPPEKSKRKIGFTIEK
jgi:hypothetical protein